MGAEKVKTPIWYWIIASILLIWNLMGILNYVQHMTVTEEMLQQMPENQRILYADFPEWVQIAFAVAVFGGAIGSIALLIKRKLAVQAFILSLIGIVVQMGHSISIAAQMDSGGEWVYIMTVLLIGTGAFAIWLSKYAVSQNWIK